MTSLGVDTLDALRVAEQWLYREARLLDTGQYEEWLETLTEDVRYFMPLVEAVHGIESDVDTRGGHYFDEDKLSIHNRIRWLTSGLAHIEVPPSLKRRVVSNVEVMSSNDNGELEVSSNFMLWQGRHRTREGVLFVGTKLDRLRTDDGVLKLSSRRIDLAHPILPRALSVFF